MRECWRRTIGVIAAAVCAAGAQAEEPLRVSGTGSALGAMRRLAEAYERAHPGEKVRLLPSVGSGGALKAVANGALDLGLTGRPLDPSEESLGLLALPYARTPFVFAVGPRASVGAITAAEVARIYAGVQRTWPNGERIRIVLRPAGDVDTRILRAISPEIAAAADAALGREGMLMAATNQECNAILERTPGALGLTSLTQALTEERRLTLLAWGDVAPTLENLASGAYPLVKTHYAVTRRVPSATVRRFLSFLGSPEGLAVLERTGNLPVPFTVPGSP